MLRSLQLALNTLASRPWRSALLAGAVALASGLVVAVSCGIGSAQASFDRAITKFIGAADARIIHPATERFDADELLETVRSWPGVEVATARSFETITLVHQDHRLDPETGLVRQVSPIAFGVEFETERQIRDLVIERGRLPQTPHEILIGPFTAEKLGAKPGDVLVVRRLGPPVEVTVAGIYHRDRLGTLQHPHARVNRALLGEITGHGGQASTITIVCAEGVDVAAFCSEHAGEIPAPLVLEPADLVRTGFDQRMRGSRLALVVLSVITFLACGSIIVIGLTTGMTERQRDMAVLRCLGATRGLLLRQQLAVGIGYGVFGAFVGVPLGLALAATLVWIFAEYLPAGLHVNALGVLLAVAGAMAAGLLGALLPAVLASRVAPLSAMSVAARPARGRAIAACAIGGIVGIAMQMALYAIDDTDLRIRLYAIAGVPALGIGAFLLAVPVIVLVTGALAGPLGRLLRLPAGMLHASIMTTPVRHGLTAGTLMIGLSMLVGTWAGMRSIMADWIDRIRFADGFAQRITGISDAEQQAIADLDFVHATCPIGYFSIQLERRVFGLEDVTPKAVNCITFDPPQFFALNEVDWLEGDPATAVPRLQDGTGVLVAEQFLAAQDIGAGDRLRLGVGELWHELEIVGVVSSAGLDLATQLFGIRGRYLEAAVSCVFMDAAAARRLYDADTVVIVQVDLDEAISDEVATARIHEAAPGVVFRSGRWIRDTIDELINGLLIVQATVSFGALVLAAVAVGNVMAAAIHGRRFEYGVLRAVGAERGVVVRLVLAEAALIALTASIVGTISGMRFAVIDGYNLRALAGLVIDPKTPWPVVFIGSTVLLALTLAASWPSVWRLARRAPALLVAGGRND